MTYEELLLNARKNMEGNCLACPVCDGRACGNKIPGPGAKGLGSGAIENYSAWQRLHLNLDAIGESGEADISATFFGVKLKMPVFAGPVGAVSQHYGSLYNDQSYNDVLVPACKEAGIAAFTGDGVDPAVMQAAALALKKAEGIGVPTIKPWNMELVHEKLQLVKEAAPVAVAMDIDASGLPFLKNKQPPAGRKAVEDLRTIAEWAGRPFIVKGIMTVKGALKALEAGAEGIVVSNHGGRVLDQCPATAEVLPKIADAVKGKLTILADGGIRTGIDVFKALALGADGVLICRPFVTAVYGGGAEGVSLYAEKLYSELSDAMTMCGAKCIADISREMLYEFS